MNVEGPRGIRVQIPDRDKVSNMNEECDQEYIDYMNALIGMDEFAVLGGIECPTCGKMVPDVFGIKASEPFTARSPMAGLTIWGAYDVPKQIICQGHSWVHFKFLYDNSERLVLMRLPLRKQLNWRKL